MLLDLMILILPPAEKSALLKSSSTTRQLSGLANAADNSRKFASITRSFSIRLATGAKRIAACGHSMWAIYECKSLRGKCTQCWISHQVLELADKWWFCVAITRLLAVRVFITRLTLHHRCRIKTGVLSTCSNRHVSYVTSKIQKYDIRVRRASRSNLVRHH